MKNMSKVKYRNMDRKESGSEDPHMSPTRKPEPIDGKHKRKSTVNLPVINEMVSESTVGATDRLKEQQFDRNALLAEIAQYKRDYNATEEKDENGDHLRSSEYRSHLQKFNAQVQQATYDHSHLQQTNSNSRVHKPSEPVQQMKSVVEQTDERKSQDDNSPDHIIDVTKAQQSSASIERSIESFIQANKQLQDKIKELEKDKVDAKEKLADTVKQWQAKLKSIEDDKSTQLHQIRTSLRAIEDHRGRDTSLLKLKMEEIESLREKQAELNSKVAQKNMEVYSLKEENARITCNFSKSAVENQSLRAQCEQLKQKLEAMESYGYKESEGTFKEKLSYRKLEDKIKELENEKTDAKEQLSETVKIWQNKLEVIEGEKANELLEIKASVAVIENTRAEDIKLLASRQEEIEKLKEEHMELQSMIMERDLEIGALKGEISSLDEILLSESPSEQDANKRCSERKIVTFDTSTLSDSEQYYFATEIKSLKKKLTHLEVVTAENKSLKSDLKSLADECKRLIQENTQVRAENLDLWHTIERNEDITSENRLLRQHMREAEKRHDDTVEHLSRENLRLRRSCNDLFKSNQDLELRHATKIGFCYRDSSGKITNESRLKSSSVGSSLDKMGLDMESFSGNLRHGGSSPSLSTLDVKPQQYHNDNVQKPSTNDDRVPDASYFTEPHEVKRPIFGIKCNPFLKYDKRQAANMIGGGSPAKRASQDATNTLIQNDNFFTLMQSKDKGNRGEENSSDFVNSLKKTITENLKDQYVNKLRDAFENI